MLAEDNLRKETLRLRPCEKESAIRTLWGWGLRLSCNPEYRHTNRLLEGLARRLELASTVSSACDNNTSFAADLDTPAAIRRFNTCESCNGPR